MLNIMNERSDVPGTFSLVKKGIRDRPSVPFQIVNKLVFTSILQKCHPLKISLTCCVRKIYLAKCSKIISDNMVPFISSDNTESS